jgi:hypothetical protein
MMRLRAVAAGFALGLAAAVLWVIGNLEVPLYVARIKCRLDPNCGGGIGASSVGSGSTLLVLLASFAAGYWWTLRRHGRASRVSE